MRNVVNGVYTASVESGTLKWSIYVHITNFVMCASIWRVKHSEGEWNIGLWKVERWERWNIARMECSEG